MTASVADFVRAMPKGELHVHLEGTLEPEMKLRLAERNGLSLAHSSIDEMRAGYDWHDLPSFLRIFYEGSLVLLHEQDFYDLCFAFLSRLSLENVRYVEMSLDPQHHVERNVPFDDIISGITRARQDAFNAFGIRSGLILCFIREKSAKSALATLHAAIAHKQEIVGIGLDSDEAGNPPIKFAQVFALARTAGFRLTAHCDVDQPDTHRHIRQALMDVEVDRIDHGLNVLDSLALVEESLRRGTTLTFCPHIIGRARAGERLAPIQHALDHGLSITINSDDPAYMKTGYVTDNLLLVQRECGFGRNEMIALQRNVFTGAWLSDETRREFLNELDHFAATW
jgi:adenine deaminase